MRAYRERRAKRIMKKSINSIGVNKNYKTTKLTNDELVRLNERLKLETEFASYVVAKVPKDTPAKAKTPAQVKTQQKGQGFVGSTMRKVGTETASTLGSHFLKRKLNTKYPMPGNVLDANKLEKLLKAVS
jgi:hypothetical protein